MTTGLATKPSTPAPPPSPSSNFLSSARRGSGRAASSSRSSRSWRCSRAHQGHDPHPAEHLQPGGAEQLHPDPGHRHGDRDHRRAHRPVRRIGRRVHRRAGRRLHRATGPAGLAGCAAGPGNRGRRRRLAGVLGRLLRHPGLHRHSGRNAHLPRRHPAGAGQQADLPVPGQLPEHLRRLRRRARRVHQCPCVPRRRRGRSVHPAAGRGLRRRADLDPDPHQGRAGQIPPERRLQRGFRRPHGHRRRGDHVLRAAAVEVQGTALRAVHPGHPGAGLLGGDEQVGFRPSCVRHRRQPARRRTVRHQGQGRDLLGLRQHGRAGRARRDRLRRPAQPGEPDQRRRRSNSTPSPPRSSAAPPSPAGSAG